jgi:putative membrane protein insertion efficiency factor
LRASSKGFLRPVFLIPLAIFCALLGDSLNAPSDQWSARAAVAAIDAYRSTASPVLRRSQLITCRYRPSCSAYGRTVFQRFGFFRGGALAAWRIARCNPFAKGGFDPPPGL